LAVLGAYDFVYFNFALPALIILVAAWASQSRNRFSRLPGILALSFAFGLFGWYKTFNAAQWLGMGGQTAINAFPAAESAPWRPDHPFRVVSIPYRIVANGAAAAGYDAFDGVINNHSRNRARFWHAAMPGAHPGIGAGTTSVTYGDAMDMLCCRTYSVESLLDLDALRSANVEYVFSALPLHGRAISMVAGPKDGVVPPRRDQPMSEKIKGFLDLLIDPPPLYVYRLDGSVPRAYMARAIEKLSAAAQNDADYFKNSVQAALDGRALVASADFPGAIPAGDAGRVVKTVKTIDGYEIEYLAPNGGVLMLNADWSPFWTARSNGKRLAVAPANAVQTAVALPPGAGVVVLTYARPRLVDLLSGQR
jgi:hypothetical protein